MAVPLPWECTVRGVPASLQASKTKIGDWRRRVAEAARERWPYGEPPLAQPLALLVAFMHWGQNLDVDNMLKPTLDGLIDVAYIDDALLEQVVGARWDLSRTLRVERLTPVLARAVVEAIVDERPFSVPAVESAGGTGGAAAVTKATQLDPGRHEATERTIERLRAAGWAVVVGPGPDELPTALSDFQPDLVAHRGDEHAIVEVKSRLVPPNLDLVTLAERIADLPGWRLEFVYVPEEPAVAEPAQLRRWASTASELAGSSPEAALLLSWAALEGLLHQLAQQRGVDTNQPGSLLAALASLGILDDDEHDRLRRAMTARNALAHGRQGPRIEASHVRDLSQLAGRLADRAEDGESRDRSPAPT